MLRSRAAAALFGFTLSWAAAACGGAASSDLLSPAAQAGPDGGGPEVGVDDAQVAPPDASSHDAHHELDAAADGPATADAGADVGDMDVVPGDDGPSTGDPGVLCSKSGSQQTFCTPTLEVCCVALQPGSGRTCMPDGVPCDGVPVHCDDTADCLAGQVCCGTQNNGNYVDVSCVADCPPQGNTFQFCDPKTNDCPPQSQCQPSMSLQGYFICR
jgi:hypothetical protein